MTSRSNSPRCSPTSTIGCRRIIRSSVWQRRCRDVRSGPSRGCSAPRSRARSGPASWRLPYAFADFINSAGAEFAALYRERFAEHEQPGKRPYTAVAVWTICAESEQEAQRLASSGRMAFTMLRRGELIAVPPPEKALEFLAGAGPAGVNRRTVIGTPDAVRSELEGVAAEYGADEVIAVNIVYDHDARRRSYELLAGAFEL